MSRSAAAMAARACAAAGMLAVCFAAGARAATPPVTYELTEAAGVPLRIIRVDLSNPGVHVRVGLAEGFPHAAESFSAMLKRMHPIAAINGAYFSKSSLAPIGDIVSHGVVRWQGMMGTALAIGAGNKAVIRRVTPSHAEDWAGYRTVMACGPALVLNGRMDVHPLSEGFGDPDIMGSATRMGVGLRADGTMLLVNTRRAVTFQQWAQVMLALGCHDALNLDAGASLAMYCHGRTIISPGRDLTNLLLITASDDAGGQTASSAQDLPSRTRPHSAVRVAHLACLRDAQADRIQLSLVLEPSGPPAKAIQITGVRFNATHGRITSQTAGPDGVTIQCWVDGGSATARQPVPLTIAGLAGDRRFEVSEMISAP